MRKLSEQEIEQIVSLLKEGKPLPEEYKAILFDTKPHEMENISRGKKEYELIYAGKEREEDILADTMAVPLQPVKTFRNGKNGPPEADWTNPVGYEVTPWDAKLSNGVIPRGNMLIFGDDLQVLKTLLQMKHKGKLKNADGTPGVRLVYIDPPFGTGDIYDAKGDEPAYATKL
ncbi:MAG: hypothetical protein ACUVRL_08545 [Candidatus Saccharicenans sp.]|uniref:hypothetical protein n=1 Tax=Candidatus Saccharicenans sp. TaxID=2819258 RepID=UPI00404B1965